MSERFIKLIPSEKTNWLIANHPNAFLLLTIIAQRARRTPGHIDGRGIGTAEIGDWEACGLTRQQYRTALDKLIQLNFLKIMETNRTRKKSTTGTTTKGTLVKLIDSSIYDINAETTNHTSNHRATTDQPLTNHEQERTRKNKNVKKTTTIVEKPQEKVSFEIVDDVVGVVGVVGLYKCLEEIEELSMEEKLAAMKHPEDRVSKAIEYAKAPTTKIKTDLISTIIWHCKQPKPIPPKPLPMTDQQTIAFRYNEVLKERGFLETYEKNQKVIWENYMFRIFDGYEQSISLNTSIQEILNDLNYSIKELGSNKIIKLTA